MKPFVLSALIALAPLTTRAECPAGPDRSAELDALFDAARAAPNEMTGRAHGSAMWEIWTEAPDEIAQDLLDGGMRALRVADYATAYDAFDRLVTYCPDYAEGWNQRAFVHFLTGGHEAALEDLDAALARNPEHVGALTGRALTLIALGREAEAQEPLRAAVALNPWVSERHLLKAPNPEGTDL